MSTSAALLASAVAGAGTLLMRLAGVTPLSRRLGDVPWMRHVPLAVLLVLAVSAVAGGGAAVPSPPVVLGTGVVVVAAAWRAPLLVSVVVGCGVYAVVGVWWPGW
ncbi:AzlD domain-containing protein [Streptomyces sp. NPDC021100]|uniref:AzlD domain-containing protein n=1 Tax=Streptomyces sp. NPDC021100 TaxID=3365114 RepID=UPI00378FDB59